MNKKKNKDNEWENDPEWQDFFDHVDKQGPWDSKDDKIHTIGGLTNDKEGGFMEFQNKMDSNDMEDEIQIEEIHQEAMKILYIDMDGVIVDFIQSAKNSPDYEKYINELDRIPDIFLNAPPMKQAVRSVNKIIDSKKYDVYIASTAPWGNIESLSHKRIWIEKYFGDKLKKRLILTHRKDLLIGDYLIDDRTANGAGKFKGKLIHFDTDQYPDWASILKYLSIN